MTTWLLYPLIAVCTCGPAAIERYRLRLSGPLLDRIDLQVYVHPVPLRELRRAEPGESSAQIRARVVAARDRQLARLRPWNLHCNLRVRHRRTCAAFPPPSARGTLGNDAQPFAA